MADTTDIPIVCFRCGRKPEELEEYVEATAGSQTTPEQFVVTQEGTFNEEERTFACTDCYIAIGMPSSRFGWTAPPRHR